MINKSTFLISVFFILLNSSCKEDLDLKPQGGVVSYPKQVAESAQNMELYLIGVYAALHQKNTATTGSNRNTWFSPSSNWVYGDVPSDDAYKGSNASDQGPLLEIEELAHNPSNIYFSPRWELLYEGISRANKMLKLIEQSEALSEDRALSMKAEARFLRGHFYFTLYQTFRNVPYLDETTKDPLQTNDADVLEKIIEDFKFAKDNLPNKQKDPARANSFSAAAYLGKALLYRACYKTTNYTANLKSDGSDFNPPSELLATGGDFQRAKEEFEYVKSGGFKLVKEFSDVYNPFIKNSNPESIFSIKNSVKDGSPLSDHGSAGDLLNYIQSGPGGQDANGCCGFYVPSENLANAYKTDDGLPIDHFTGHSPNEFNDDNATGGDMSDFGVEPEDNFNPYSGTLDPRLDFTVGRRGIPFLDYGLHPGSKWSRSSKDQGNYSRKKRYISKKAYNSGYGDKPSWFVTVAIDYHVIRYADVLLMLAECEVELGNLNAAKDLVNEVRNRAKTSTYLKTLDGTDDAANYSIKPYASFSSKEQARAAVRFERRLELALEGHRFFDLVRWGIAEDVINTYKDGESISYAGDINFSSGKNEFYPIPQRQIDLSQKEGESVLTQNPGY